MEVIICSPWADPIAVNGWQGRCLHSTSSPLEVKEEAIFSQQMLDLETGHFWDRLSLGSEYDALGASPWYWIHTSKTDVTYLARIVSLSALILLQALPYTFLTCLLTPDHLSSPETLQESSISSLKTWSLKTPSFLVFLHIALWIRPSWSWGVFSVVLWLLAHPRQNILEWNGEPLVSELKGISNLGIVR